jgi:hypothetical protein
VEASEDRPLDVVIVGAGTAGLAALREVRKRTDRFALVNDGPYGTTCARVGCMPSKALIAAMDALHARAKLDEFGIRGGDGLRADLPAVLARVRALRDHFVAGVLETTADRGERNIAGRARLDGPNRVVVGERVLHARQVVLARLEPGGACAVAGSGGPRPDHRHALRAGEPAGEGRRDRPWRHRRRDRPGAGAARARRARLRCR